MGGMEGGKVTASLLLRSLTASWLERNTMGEDSSCLARWEN